MNEALEQLNEATPDAAEARFLDCCGSREWARAMTAARPFADATALFKQAEQIWLSLDTSDWLEAFAAHPKIGARAASPKQQIQAAEWSRGEQASVESAGSSVLDDLAEANRLYEEKFGYIFIVCATGKSAAEMLDLCRRRLENNPDAEIRIAADEQRQITEIRLKKLLEAGN